MPAAWRAAMSPVDPRAIVEQIRDTLARPDAGDQPQI
jgi:hypothetical protein